MGDRGAFPVPERLPKGRQAWRGDTISRARSVIKPYKRKKKPRPGQVGNVQRLGDVGKVIESYSGFIRGKAAKSLDEERVARALDINGIPFIFEFVVDTAWSLPGKERSIDFMIELGGEQFPLEVKGAIGHASAENQKKDLLREAILQDELKKFGITQLFISIFDYDTETQEDANTRVRNLL